MRQPGTSVRVDHLNKTFVMHLRGGVRIPAVRDVSFHAAAGQCLVLAGPSGAGKSSILKMIYGSYRADSGSIVFDDGCEACDVVEASPRRILALRSRKIGYVSQFLRVIPRVSTLDIIRSACAGGGTGHQAAQVRAEILLKRLNIPEALWSLPPQTFSGGEQQRINIARCFGADKPVLLLDEPTASLDAENKAVVTAMIREKKRAGVTIIGIFHDTEIREAVADKVIAVEPIDIANSETEYAVTA